MKNIEEVLNKYYSGETSLEEELQLQDFFEREEIPDHLKKEQKHFQLTALMSAQKNSLTEGQLFEKLPHEQAEQSKVIRINPWFGRVAAAIVFMVVGYGVSQLMIKDEEVDAIKAEMAQMKAMMLDQLESSSASGRLQAVNYSFQITNADEQTIGALIETMLFDKNMHVRSKAVEALVHFGEHPKVGEALTSALSTEEEPAVQIAMISAIVSLKNKSAVKELQQLTENEDVLKDVRDEAQLSIFKLKEM